MVHQHTVHRTTSSSGDMHDLTDEVSAAVGQSGISAGIVNVSVIGSTAAIGCVEFEPGLKRDLPELLNRLIPANRHYGHEQAWHDGNAHSHLQATLLNGSVTVPVAGGRPVLGTWQQIFLLECDIRPRWREVVVTVIGE